MQFSFRLPRSSYCGIFRERNIPFPSRPISTISGFLQQKKNWKPLEFSDKELTLSNFENILKQHSNRFNEMGIMEEILPRSFKNESELQLFSENFAYAQGSQDFISLSKVKFR